MTKKIGILIMIQMILMIVALFISLVVVLMAGSMCIFITGRLVQKLYYK